MPATLATAAQSLNLHPPCSWESLRKGSRRLQRHAGRWYRKGCAVLMISCNLHDPSLPHRRRSPAAHRRALQSPTQRQAVVRRCQAYRSTCGRDEQRLANASTAGGPSVAVAEPRTSSAAGSRNVMHSIGAVRPASGRASGAVQSQPPAGARRTAAPADAQVLRGVSLWCAVYGYGGCLVEPRFRAHRRRRLLGSCDSRWPPATHGRRDLPAADVFMNVADWRGANWASAFRIMMHAVCSMRVTGAKKEDFTGRPTPREMCEC